MKISAGLRENNIVVGNTYDKYGSSNPLVRRIMQSFANDLSDLVSRASPGSIHEVGCGEGYWVVQWSRQGFAARGSDFSTTIIEMARANAGTQGMSCDLFEVRSIYDLTPERDSADLIVCCEVLEHLEYPARALAILREIAANYVILSVPREPLWRVLNVARGKYLSDIGNTEGHIQHWSQKSFVELVSQYFDVVEVRAPLPWTMLLCRARQ